MSNKKLSATYGLVACGGSSSRMGRDKSMLNYNGKPQRYHVFEMLQTFCEKVFISCKEEQAGTVEDGYPVLTDHPVYNDTGPMAALLTAFSTFPGKNILLIGCDYPFLSTADLQQFADQCNNENAAVAFYNDKEELYEPLLAWYNYNSFAKLKEMFDDNQYSLQYFLKMAETIKLYPGNEKSIISVDSPEGFSRSLILDSGFWIEHNY